MFSYQMNFLNKQKSLKQISSFFSMDFLWLIWESENYNIYTTLSGGSICACSSAQGTYQQSAFSNLSLHINLPKNAKLKASPLIADIRLVLMQPNSIVSR